MKVTSMKERKTRRVQLLMKPSCYAAYMKAGNAAGYSTFTQIVDAALGALWLTQTRKDSPERKGFEHV